MDVDTCSYTEEIVAVQTDRRFGSSLEHSAVGMQCLVTTPVRRRLDSTNLVGVPSCPPVPKYPYFPYNCTVASLNPNPNPNPISLDACTYSCNLNGSGVLCFSLCLGTGHG